MDLRGVGALALTLCLAACTSAGPAPEPPPVPPVPAPTPAPSYLDGAAMPTPTGLRFVFGGGAIVDVDAGRTDSLPVTGWLDRPGKQPVLVEEKRTGADFGRTIVQVREQRGRPVVRLTAPALAYPAASADGQGVWLAEYLDRTGCTLREVGLDGRDRRPARPVECGTNPIAETSHGLWVDVGPDAFIQAKVGSSATEQRAVLLDPATLAERATYPRVAVIDDDRVFVLGESWELRDLRTGQVTPIARPPARGWPDPRVGDISGDRRYVPFTFGEPGNAPQIMDLWLLDLDTATWTRLPLMPVYTSLKGTDVGWAADGRLVLVGRFPEKGLIATWRPGDAGYLVGPFDRPETPAGAPVDTRFLVS
jgi:hypothetical protein